MDNTILIKNQLTTKQLAIAQSEYDNKKRSKTTAYLMWFFLGVVGAHRYYAGDWKRGIAMTLTLGLFGFWTLIDVFFIGSRIDEKNRILESQILTEIASIDDGTNATQN